MKKKVKQTADQNFWEIVRKLKFISQRPRARQCRGDLCMLLIKERENQKPAVKLHLLL